jgi:hypothetical protein
VFDVHNCNWAYIKNMLASRRGLYPYTDCNLSGGKRHEAEIKIIIPAHSCIKTEDSATWYPTQVSSTVLTTVLCDPLLL